MGSKSNVFKLPVGGVLGPHTLQAKVCLSCLQRTASLVHTVLTERR